MKCTRLDYAMETGPLDQFGRDLGVDGSCGVITPIAEALEAGPFNQDRVETLLPRSWSSEQRLHEEC